MQSKLPSWYPTGRGIAENVVAGAILTAVGIVAAAIIAWWADLPLTRAGSIIFAVGLLLAFALAWVLFAVGWRIFYPAKKQDDAARQVWRGIAEALEPFADKEAVKRRQATKKTALSSAKSRDWTAYERDERAKQISEVLKFLESDVTPVLAEAHRLAEAHSLPWRNRMRAPTYVRDLLANRDASREITKTLQQMAASYYSDIATIFDEHNFMRLVSAEENFHRSLINALQLPPDTKTEILLDLLGPRVANFTTSVDELRRWHGAARRDLITLRETGG